MTPPKPGGNRILPHTYQDDPYNFVGLIRIRDTFFSYLSLGVIGGTKKHMRLFQDRQAAVYHRVPSVRCRVHRVRTPARRQQPDARRRGARPRGPAHTSRHRSQATGARDSRPAHDVGPQARPTSWRGIWWRPESFSIRIPRQRCPTPGACTRSVQADRRRRQARRHRRLRMRRRAQALAELRAARRMERKTTATASDRRL